MVVFVYYGSEGVLINCCIRHCSIGNCRTGEGCTRSVGFLEKQGYFLVVLVTLVFGSCSRISGLSWLS